MRLSKSMCMTVDVNACACACVCVCVHAYACTHGGGGGWVRVCMLHHGQNDQEEFIYGHKGMSYEMFERSLLYKTRCVFNV